MLAPALLVHDLLGDPESRASCRISMIRRRGRRTRGRGQDGREGEDHEGDGENHPLAPPHDSPVVNQVTLLFLINYAFNWLFAEKIGTLISRIGERAALTIEYVGLIGVFTAYAFVENAYLAAGLYVVDHMFFALAIAMNTYFQKIASPEDIASSAGVSFTINHIAAVVIPVLFGLLWLQSPALAE